MRHLTWVLAVIAALCGNFNTARGEDIYAYPSWTVDTGVILREHPGDEQAFTDFALLSDGPVHINHLEVGVSYYGLPITKIFGTVGLFHQNDDGTTSLVAGGKVFDNFIDFGNFSVEGGYHSYIVKGIVPGFVDGRVNFSLDYISGYSLTTGESVWLSDSISLDTMYFRGDRIEPEIELYLPRKVASSTSPLWVETQIENGHNVTGLYFVLADWLVGDPLLLLESRVVGTGGNNYFYSQIIIPDNIPVDSYRILVYVIDNGNLYKKESSPIDIVLPLVIYGVGQSETSAGALVSIWGESFNEGFTRVDVESLEDDHISWEGEATSYAYGKGGGSSAFFTFPELLWNFHNSGKGDWTPPDRVRTEPGVYRVTFYGDAGSDSILVTIVDPRVSMFTNLTGQTIRQGDPIELSFSSKGYDSITLYVDLIVGDGRDSRHTFTMNYGGFGGGTWVDWPIETSYFPFTGTYEIRAVGRNQVDGGSATTGRFTVTAQSVASISGSGKVLAQIEEAVDGTVILSPTAAALQYKLSGKGKKGIFSFKGAKKKAASK